MKVTFEEYLRNDYERDVIDHTIRVSTDGDGQLKFYIHPLNMDGNTLDFRVHNNALFLIKQKQSGEQNASE